MNIQILISSLIVISSLLLIGIIGFLCVDKLDTANAYIQCCDGNQCTDTYYTSKDNLCHLVLCENSLFTNKQDCVYPGKGITLNLS